MEKSIKDYLHLYLGCECQMMGQEDETQTFKLTGVSYDDLQKTWWAYFADTEEMYAVIEDVFLILRPLSDMTEEEFEEFKKHSEQDYSKMVLIESMCKPDEYTRVCQSAFAQQYLLSKGFDLFGLIDAELAIDKTKVKDTQR